MTEPYISLAEKMGCRMVVAAFHHGTEVASDRVDAETYSAFNRAVREAVRRINANKRSYMHYFIDYYKNKDPQIAQLTIDDLRESRIFLVDPAPIPADELQRTYEWMKSWDFLESGCAADELVNMNVQQHGYEKAPHEPAAGALIARAAARDLPAPAWNPGRRRLHIGRARGFHRAAGAPYTRATNGHPSNSCSAT